MRPIPSVHYSKHARVRMQQRGIPVEVVECLLRFGRAQHDKHGAAIVYFDKAGRKRLMRGNLSRQISNLEHFLRAYAVVSLDGTVCTVSYREKRIWRY